MAVYLGMFAVFCIVLGMVIYGSYVGWAESKAKEKEEHAEQVILETIPQYAPVKVAEWHCTEEQPQAVKPQDGSALDNYITPRDLSFNNGRLTHAEVVKFAEAFLQPPAIRTMGLYSNVSYQRLSRAVSSGADEVTIRNAMSDGFVNWWDALGIRGVYVDLARVSYETALEFLKNNFPKALEVNEYGLGIYHYEVLPRNSVSAVVFFNSMKPILDEGWVSWKVSGTKVVETLRDLGYIGRQMTSPVVLC